MGPLPVVRIPMDLKALIALSHLLAPQLLRSGLMDRFRVGNGGEVRGSQVAIGLKSPRRLWEWSIETTLLCIFKNRKLRIKVLV